MTIRGRGERETRRQGATRSPGDQPATRSQTVRHGPTWRERLGKNNDGAADSPVPRRAVEKGRQRL